jgi:hypothetical protein
VIIEVAIYCCDLPWEYQSTLIVSIKRLRYVGLKYEYRYQLYAFYVIKVQLVTEEYCTKTTHYLYSGIELLGYSRRGEMIHVAWL